jgi:ABC-2 type transport system ATP-binding protein
MSAPNARAVALDLNGEPLAVATQDLCKQYGKIDALRDVSLQVPTGATYLLVGPNGAGKSTTIRILLDLVRPSSGSAEIMGYGTHTEAALARAQVGYVPEQLNWGHGWMRVGRLLEHHARYFPSWDAQYAARLTREFSLRLDQRMETLSKGQGRRVHLVMALAHRPPLLILDEPTDGLDPVMRDEALGMLSAHMAETPTTILLSTHHVMEMEHLADHIGVLRDGQLRAQLLLDSLRTRLRRYRARIPAGWASEQLQAVVLRKTTTRDELDWTIWGDERDVVEELAARGAHVSDSSPLSLNDATLALLTSTESLPRRAANA